MRLDGFRGKHQVSRDLAAGKTLADQGCHLFLAPRKRPPSVMNALRFMTGFHTLAEQQQHKLIRRKTLTSCLCFNSAHELTSHMP